VKFFSKKSFWQWVLFLPKAYIIAVPIFVLFLQFLEKNVLVGKSKSISYWDARMQTRMLGDEWERLFHLIAWGYLVCLLILFLEIAFVDRKQKKGEIGSALIFAILALISMCVLHVEILFFK